MLQTCFESVMKEENFSTGHKIFQFLKEFDVKIEPDFDLSCSLQSCFDNLIIIEDVKSMAKFLDWNIYEPNLEDCLMEKHGLNLLRKAIKLKLPDVVEWALKSEVNPLVSSSPDKFTSVLSPVFKKESDLEIKSLVLDWQRRQLEQLFSHLHEFNMSKDINSFVHHLFKISILPETIPSLLPQQYMSRGRKKVLISLLLNFYYMKHIKKEESEKARKNRLDKFYKSLSLIKNEQSEDLILPLVNVSRFAKSFNGFEEREVTPNIGARIGEFRPNQIQSIRTESQTKNHNTGFGLL